MNHLFTVAYAIASVIFFVFEVWALMNKTPGDTITEHVRHYFRTKGKVGSFAFLVVFGTFAAWFSVHIVNGVL